MYSADPSTQVCICQCQAPIKDKEREGLNVRKSPRLKEKNSGGKAIMKLAQDLVAKKCGILKKDEELDNMTLQQYLNVYKQPLTDQAMEAIGQLIEWQKGKRKRRSIRVRRSS
jgi:hypothetical protein